MKKYSILVFYSIILFSCNSIENKKTNTQSEFNKEISQDEVNSVIHKWLNLWGTYDLNLLDDIFYQSEDLTYFSSEKEGLIKGYDQLNPHHAGFGFVEGGKQPEKSLWLENIETKIYKESAMVAAIWYFGDKDISKNNIQKGPVTFILIKK